MTRDEYETLMESLGVAQREMIDLAGERPICGPDFYLKVGGNGRTEEFRALQKLGLLRKIGTRPSKVKKSSPMHYALVPMAEIEEAREAYQAQLAREAEKAQKAQPVASKAPRRRSRMEGIPRRTDGSYEKWHRTRQNLVQMAGSLSSQLPEQAFWNVIPDEEIVRFLEEMAELDEALQEGLRLIEMRVDDDELRSKIAKLRRTASSNSGATAPEQSNARAVAAKLSRRILLDS